VYRLTKILFMKKNLLGILSLVLAIALSSFTELQNKKQDNLVWFDVIGGETSTTGGVLLSAPPTGCENETTDLCARGYDIEDCTEDFQGGSTTYSLNVDPEDWEDEGYKE
jgi:hypothetical protein